MNHCPGRSGTVVCKLQKDHAGYCWNGIRFDGGLKAATPDDTKAARAGSPQGGQ